MKRFLIILILRPAHVGIQQPPLAMLLHLPPEQAKYNMLCHISITAKNPEDTALNTKRANPQYLNLTGSTSKNPIETTQLSQEHGLVGTSLPGSLPAYKLKPSYPRMNSLLVLQNASYVFSGCLL
jgi:hypothetical protein